MSVGKIKEGEKRHATSKAACGRTNTTAISVVDELPILEHQQPSARFERNI